MILQIHDKKIIKVKEREFKLEKDLQIIIEQNLPTLLDLELVKSECKIANYRIDTLAFDKYNNSSVIIEYKKGSSYSVIDQGYSYLSALLNNKADIILEYAV